MTGCYIPNHRGIDNCIHFYRGILLRIKCKEIMEEQGYEEPVGKAKITLDYNLPCQYILHTVGTMISHELTQADCDLLASCYRFCLKLAEPSNLF